MGITQAQAIDLLAALQIATATSTTDEQDSTAMSVDPTTATAPATAAAATTTTAVVSLLTEAGDPEDVTRFLALVEADRVKAIEAAAAAKATAAAAAAAAAYNTTLSLTNRGGGGGVGGGGGKHSLYEAGLGEVDEYGYAYDQGGDEGGEIEFQPPKRHKSSGGGGGRKSAAGGGVVLTSGGVAGGGGDEQGYADAQGLGDGLALAPRAAWLTNAEGVYKAVARHAFVSPEKYRGEQVAADFFHPVLDMYPQVNSEQICLNLFLNNLSPSYHLPLFYPTYPLLPSWPRSI